MAMQLFQGDIVHSLFRHLLVAAGRVDLGSRDQTVPEERRKGSYLLFTNFSFCLEVGLHFAVEEPRSATGSHD
ncbi:hypothetical protein BR93DRAFT_26182 [Coniochaeta sp. PMI_546]|nr:hypothetical protein BR93DRAFT_26182 [Coniochaeta sp. PMI_546]